MWDEIPEHVATIEIAYRRKIEGKGGPRRLAVQLFSLPDWNFDGRLMSANQMHPCIDVGIVAREVCEDRPSAGICAAADIPRAIPEGVIGDGGASIPCRHLPFTSHSLLYRYSRILRRYSSPLKSRLLPLPTSLFSTFFSIVNIK